MKTKEELIEKWQNIHAKLLSDYQSYEGLKDFEALCLRSEMQKVLEFIDDLKNVK